jgi:hypothetical protein
LVKKKAISTVSIEIYKGAFFERLKDNSNLCIKTQKVHLFGRDTHNVFRVRLGKNFEKHELIVNFEVIFDKCQVR